MQLKWYGHAAFRITASNGLSIITDPYTPETSGYIPIAETADMVITSSDNDSFHCRSDLIPGNPAIINALYLAQQGGIHEEKGITIRAIQAMEMQDHPHHDPDQNGMYRFEVDGIQIAHMGDVGNPLTEAQIAFFKDVDILLALAGDVPTIALDDLKTVIDGAKPKYVVPMHFRTLSYKPRNSCWVTSFLSYFEEERVDFAFHYAIDLTADDIPDHTRALVMDYMR